VVKPERTSEPTTPSFGMFAYKLACGLAAVPTPVLQKKLNEVVQCRADLPAKERRFLSGALPAVAKRFEQIADKIDIDEPREMTSISPDAPGASSWSVAPAASDRSTSPRQ
jgi:hypothetical protein